MNRKIGVLVVHGMGSQQGGFAKEFIEEVSDRLDDRAVEVAWQEADWGEELQDREKELWNCMGKAEEPDGSKIPLDSRWARKFVVHYLGDAVAYQKDLSKTGDTYEIINAVVSDRLARLKTDLASADAPIVVIAHSLGGHIMSNYIWDRQNPGSGAADHLESIDSLAGMITFGCNIPLFSLAFPVAKPINLPGTSASDRIKAEAKWLNFLDRDDILAWPLKTLYEKNWSDLTDPQKGTTGLIEDYEINVGSMLTSWNWASHADYWTDNDFTKPVARYLRKLARAV